MRTSKRQLLLATLACLLLAVAGCGSGAAVKSPSAFDRFIDSAPTLPAVPLGETPLWNSDGLPIKHVAGLQFRGSTAIVTGTAEVNSSTGYVTVVDAATGAVTWSIKTLDDLPGGGGAVLWDTTAYAVGTADNWVVLVDYFASQCTQPSGMCPPGAVESTDEHGVAALSPRDGSVLWKVAGVPSVAEDSDEADDLDDLSAKLMTASDGAALLVVAPTDAIYGSQYVEPDKVKIVALNPIDGSTLWTTTGLWPTQIVDDVVLGSAPPDGPDDELVNKMGTPVALDVTSGAQIWSLAEDFPQSQAIAAVSDAVLIDRYQKGKLDNILIRMEDGSKIADVGSAPMSCATDPTAGIMACSKSADAGGSRVMTYHSGDVTFKVSKKSFPGSSVDAVWHGYVFVSGGTSSDGNQYRAVDYAGNVVSSQLPGEVVAINDQYAAFDTSKEQNSDPGSFAVYGLAV